ncbi:MAG: endonuclease V [Candidatus Bathyarchaeota archaeon]|nr:endonuclease V [Candidatus Bathyarchaeum sp.]
MELSIKLNPKFSIKKAHELQGRLSEKLSFEDTLPETVDYVAGVDVAYLKGLSVGAVVVLDFDTLSVVEFQVAHVKTRFPYVPTLLSFMEIPPAYLAIRKLHLEPDVFLVDGQGFAHPYGLGFASHLGLILDKPTVGVAKSRLCGKLESIGNHQQVALLNDDGVVIGAEVITKQRTKPVYVSVGNKVSLERAVRLVVSCAQKYRLPEPVRMAHLIAGSEKRKLQSAL